MFFFHSSELFYRYSFQVERAEISTPSTAQSRGKHLPNKGGPSRQRPKTAQVTVAPTAEASSNAGTSTSGEATLSDQIRVLQEKNKKKLRVAKAYAEQNRKLKERLKQMREEFYELRRNRVKNESGATSPSPHLNGALQIFVIFVFQFQIFDQFMEI
ncbi:hypothetical protein ANCCAN_11758 [Ancylostoma caninum]|uniref:Uncharacterized protein n=1 Tax=Ancylostoma caninum TaxID=29170 RepID=A0A368GCY8_ANCCA|nr:hypothetical protein ANCCAN_11758 [Ancylostoma caninum]